jgi:hypothetical protein
MRHGSVVEMNRESFPVLSVSLDEIWLCVLPVIPVLSVSLDEIWLCVLPVTFNERGRVSGDM